MIFGSQGMAGHMVSAILHGSNKYHVIDITRGNDPDKYQADVRDENAIYSVLEKASPDFIINGVGLLVKACSQNPVNAIKVNSLFPKILEKEGYKRNIRLIHISTDCVFSGRTGSYTENDVCDGYDYYARTKILGEINNDKDITLRTSIIGPELKIDGTGLFHWFMNQSGNINGYSNAIWSGITTLELAKVILHVIENKLTGIVNITNGIPISKLELLQQVKKIWNKDNINIMDDKTVRINKKPEISKR